MNLLVRSQLRFVARAPWSAATALLGVALGVASVVAVHLISVRVVESLDEAAPPHLVGISHVLERPGLTAGDYFELRERWRAHPGSRVEGLVPVVEGGVSLADRRVRVLGADWLALPPQSGAAGASEGFAVSDDVLVGEAVMADPSLGFEAGDRVTVGERSYGVAGVGETGLGGTLVADIAAAQIMLDAGPDAVSRIGMAVADPWQPWRRWLDRLMPGFAAGLPRPGAGDPATLAPALFGDGREWRVVPASAQRPSAEFARAVLFNLGALGTLALLVAWFLIYQVGVIWLRRQRLLLERLHGVGVSTRALGRSFMAVFLTMGALATVVGTLFGVLLASALTGLASQGLEVPSPAPAGFGAVDGWVAAKAVASGLGVCLLGGVGAFSREWGRRAVEETRGASWRRGVLIVVLAAVIAAGLLVEDSGVFGGFLAILAMSLAGVALVSPVLGLLRRAVTRLRGSMLTRLALRDVAWYPRMLGVALAALSLAVATSIGIALMVESFRSDFERMLDVRLAGDLYVEVAGADADTVRQWLEARPEVEAASWFGRERVHVEGIPVELGYSRFDAAESARYRHSGPLAAGEALVSERLARDLDVDPGDRVTVSQGALTVVGVFPGFGDPMGRLLVDLSSLEALGVEPRFDRVTVALRGGAGSSLAGALTARFPTVEVQSRTELRALALRIFDRTFAITQALTLLALVVAVVGTYNALTALRLHQAATTALLRAEGVTWRQIRRITLIRAGTVGGIAMLLALPLGLAMAWTLCAVINPRSFGWTVDLHLPVSAWLPPLLLGVAAAVLAGVLPAPRERGAVHEGA